jgi:hypothetical protein
MPEHDPTHADRLTAYRRAHGAEKATQEDAMRVVERWKAALVAGRGALWSPTIRAAIGAGVPWLDVHCPGCKTMLAGTDSYCAAGPAVTTAITPLLTASA